MYDDIRIWLASALWFLAFYLVWDLMSTGFDVIVFVSCIASFVAGYYLVRKKSEDAPSNIFDGWDFVLMIPFRGIAMLLRSISKLLRIGVDDIE